MVILTGPMYFILKAGEDPPEHFEQLQLFLAHREDIVETLTTGLFVPAIFEGCFFDALRSPPARRRPRSATP
jgi:hypothetical protein